MTKNNKRREFLPLVPLDTPEQWVAQAIRLYGLTYNFMFSPTPSEYRRLEKRLAQLKLSTPEQYKTGVHLIGPGAAHLGEDIFVADGVLTHYIHLDCPRCNKAGLIARDKTLFAEAETKRWCTKCNQFVSPWPRWKPTVTLLPLSEEDHEPK